MKWRKEKTPYAETESGRRDAAERARLNDALVDGRLFREAQDDPPMWGLPWFIANKAWAQLEERIAALEDGSDVRCPRCGLSLRDPTPGDASRGLWDCDRCGRWRLDAS